MNATDAATGAPAPAVDSRAGGRGAGGGRKVAPAAAARPLLGLAGCSGGGGGGSAPRMHEAGGRRRGGATLFSEARGGGGGGRGGCALRTWRPCVRRRAHASPRLRRRPRSGGARRRRRTRPTRRRRRRRRESPRDIAMMDAGDAVSREDVADSPDSTVEVCPWAGLKLNSKARVTGLSEVRPPPRRTRLGGQHRWLAHANALARDMRLRERRPARVRRGAVLCRERFLQLTHHVLLACRRACPGGVCRLGRTAEADPRTEWV